jgi:hypothetical protein
MRGVRSAMHLHEVSSEVVRRVLEFIWPICVTRDAEEIPKMFPYHMFAADV